MSESLLYFPAAEAERLEPRLPPPVSSPPSNTTSEPPGRPFVTLTYATSLDSALSLGHGLRTTLSGPQSKAMTHYLRSRHDAICVGVGTAIADDPGLNCRLVAAATATATTTTAAAEVPGEEASSSTGRADDAIFATHQPRPIILDPDLRWDLGAESRVLQVARAGKGLAPYILTSVREPPEEKQRLLRELGGKVITLYPSLDNDTKPCSTDSTGRHFDWPTILSAVSNEGLRSIMIEGGGAVINSLLSAENVSLVDSVIVTVAPTWLGRGSVTVSPPRSVDDSNGPVARLRDLTWMPLGEDVVLCGSIK